MTGADASSNAARHAPFIPILIFLILGILAGAYFLPPIREGVLPGMFVLLLGLGIYLHVIRGRSVVLKYARAGCLYLCFSLMGVFVIHIHDVRCNPAWYGHQLPDADAFMIKTSGWVIPKAKTVFVPATVTASCKNGVWTAACGSLNLYLYKTPAQTKLPPGSILVIPNRLQKIQNSGNPFGFDYATYLARRNIFHQAFLSRDEVLIRPAAAEAAGWLGSLRLRLMGALKQNVPDTVTRSLIEATLLNERGELRQDVRKAYAVTGIAHIISISGMHIGIFLGILLFLLQWIRHRRWEGLKYALAIPVVWFYVALTGFPPSAVRAAVMFTLVALGILLGSERNSINILCATAFLLLVCHPEWLFDAGVQLSFLAVLSILIFYRPVYAWWQPSHPAIRYLWSIVAVSIAAQLLVFPLVIYYFHQFPAWVLVAGIPAAIYSGLLMGGSLLLFLLDLFTIPCAWLGWLLTWMTKGFHGIIFFLADHSPSMLQHLWLDEPEFWLLLGGIAGLAVFWFKKRVAFLYGALFCWLFLAGDWLLLDLRAAHRQQIVVYDVSGQSVIDLFYGKSFVTLHLEPVSARTKRYNLLPARLGYRAAGSNSGAAVTTIWWVGGQTILFLQEEVLPADRAVFPVDVLIVNEDLSFRPVTWEQVFQPRLVVLDGSFPRWKAKKWRQALGACRMPVYDVGAAGAWVFPKE